MRTAVVRSFARRSSTATPRRSALYIPGSNLRALEKAKALPADVLILDCEDAVAPSKKELARQQIADVVRSSGYGRREIVVRINSPRHPAGLRDLLGLVESAVPPHGVLLPKASSAAELRWVAELLSHAARPVALLYQPAAQCAHEAAPARS